MERLYKNPNITVQKSPVHGWGVFATQDIPEGTILEDCAFREVGKFTSKEYSKLTGIHNYAFYDVTGKNTCVVFGYGSLFNSSEEPNATWAPGEEYYRFYTTRDIKAGEEIFLNYSIEFHK